MLTIGSWKTKNGGQLTMLRGTEVVRGILVQVERDTDAGDVICALELRFEGQSLAAEASDFFDALIQLREQLEGQSLLIRVNGACKNVWPSGMARSMGLGLKAYRMKMGTPALTADLVEIFASEPNLVPSSVAEQERYRDEWFASLGRDA